MSVALHICNAGAEKKNATQWLFLFRPLQKMRTYLSSSEIDSFQTNSGKYKNTRTLKKVQVVATQNYGMGDFPVWVV